MAETDGKALLKGIISNEFNRVAPKVVKVDDLIQAFDNLAGNNLGLLERSAVRGKVQEMVQQDVRGTGVFQEPGPDGKPVMYVNSTFVKQTMIRAVDSGKLPEGYNDTVRRVSLTAAQAIEKCEDHSEKARAGLIKPKL